MKPAIKPKKSHVIALVPGFEAEREYESTSKSKAGGLTRVAEREEEYESNSIFLV